MVELGRDTERPTEICSAPIGAGDVARTRSHYVGNVGANFRIRVRPKTRMSSETCAPASTTAASAAASAAATLSASTVRFSGSTRALQIVPPAGLSSTTISPTLRTLIMDARLCRDPSTRAQRSPRGPPVGNIGQVYSADGLNDPALSLGEPVRLTGSVESSAQRCPLCPAAAIAGHPSTHVGVVSG